MRTWFAALTLVLSTSATAMEINGITVPDNIRLGPGGTALVLNGAGVRKRLVFNVYIAALYLPAKKISSDEILQDELPRRLLLHMLRDLTSTQLNTSLNEALGETLSTTERLPLEPRMKQLYAIIESMSELKEGVQITIDYAPQSGTLILIGGEEKGRIPGADFARALLRIWIGEHPRDPDLKKALLGL